MLLLAGWIMAAAPAGAEVAVKVTFLPMAPEFQRLQPAIREHITVAVQEWMKPFAVKDCTLEVEFGIKSWPARGTGRSFVSTSFQKTQVDGKNLTEEGAAHELRTGEDPNGEKPDIEMFFDPVYFRTLWFDPNPRTRTAPVPDAKQQKLDAYTVILHEIGHAIGFNGFRNQKTGVLPDKFMSVYDRWVTFDGKNFYFNGPETKKHYGKPVLLAHTNNNYHHVGEKGDNRDPSLATDMMNGIQFEWGRRYYITPLDIAMLSDCGYVRKN